MIYEREGVPLARSTLCNWSTGLLRHIVDAMAKDAKSAHCIAIDATGVLVQAKEKCRRGFEKGFGLLFHTLGLCPADTAGPRHARCSV